MIQLRIDMSAATQQEIAALEATPGYLEFIREAKHRGRANGIALQIAEPASAAAQSMLASLPPEQRTPEMAAIAAPR